MRAFIVLAALSGTALAAPAASSSFGAHTVVDLSRKTAYVMIDNKGQPQLVAIDLATGKRRWTSTTAVKPIIARGDKLVALSGGGDVLVLDAKTGTKSTSCGAIVGVTAPFVDGLGVHQSAGGFDDGSTLYLMWTQQTSYAGGAAPTAEVEARSNRRSELIWSLDLTACKATQAKPTLDLRTLIDKTSDIITASGKTARIALDPTKQTITLTPAAVTTKKPIDLTEGDDTRTTITISIDHRQVICGNPITGALAMFDLDTGAVTHPRTSFPFVWLIVGKRLLMGAGGVTAFDTATGKSLWTVAERSTAYNGPYPPQAARTVHQ